jgi:hypothetical protein
MMDELLMWIDIQRKEHLRIDMFNIAEPVEIWEADLSIKGLTVVDWRTDNLKW